MYSEEECWNRMRLGKAEIIQLTAELAIDQGLGYLQINGNAFQPIELVVVLLPRMADSTSSWERLLGFLGGRARSAYSAAFYYAVDYIYNTFKHCIDDIGRWAGNMQARRSASAAPAASRRPLSGRTSSAAPEEGVAGSGCFLP